MPSRAITESSTGKTRIDLCEAIAMSFHALKQMKNGEYPLDTLRHIKDRTNRVIIEDRSKSERCGGVTVSGLSQET